MGAFFDPGDHVLLREVWRGKTWTLRQAIVVQDDQSVIALYVPHGSRSLEPARSEGSLVRLPRPPWVLADHTRRGHLLRLTGPGASYSLHTGWEADGAPFPFWYVNLEEPLRRTRRGFEYMDRTLDLVVNRDLSSWRWKDEDELREAVESGLYSEDAAAGIRADGERALEDILARRPPYDERWLDWRPPADWTIPADQHSTT